MESVDIEGIKVLFPFKPYDIQLDYMKCVIKCLQKKSNGLLESPTGTGKTLCLLCSTMAWMENIERQSADKQSMNTSTNGQIKPRILYSSRTHSQLSQTVRQLKQTPYKSHKSIVMASRDQLCLKSEVRSLSGTSLQSQMCRQMCKQKECEYFENYEQKIDTNIDSYNESRDNCRVLDIEDLIDFGRQFDCCPYYGSRHLSRKSSLVLTPYNYILDPMIRRSQSLELKNCVVVFDEGHNIEKVCEDCMSTELSAETLNVCIKHINSIAKKLKKIEDKMYVKLDRHLMETLDYRNVCQLKTFLMNLHKNIFDLISKESYPQTRQLFDVLEKSGLNFKILGHFMELINQIREITVNNTTRSIDKTFSYCSALNCFSDSIEKIFPIDLRPETYESHKTMFCQKYKIFGSVEDCHQISFTLHIWCLSPSVGAKVLTDQGIYNMIITSGTLAPIDSFETEMQTNFDIKLENKHIIESNQLMVLTISQSKQEVNLISNYMNRKNKEYYMALGLTLTEILSIVPKGVLIFFSSYAMLRNCMNYWKQSSNLWQRMSSLKQLFVETNDKKLFNESVVKFKLKIDEHNSSGAVFLAVCRGKLSEGIDLPDDYCRCVVMTGLPFPSVIDPKVRLKKEYLIEAKSTSINGLSAEEWYVLQMKRALNQSIGRIVRHQNDFGVVLLLDSRFTSLNCGLSKWVHPFIIKDNKGITNSSLQLNRCLFNQKFAKLRKFFSPFDPNIDILCDMSPKKFKSNNCYDFK